MDRWNSVLALVGISSGDRLDAVMTKPIERRKPAARRRIFLITVRLTELEFGILSEMVNYDVMPTPAALIRKLIVQEAERRRRKEE